MTRDRRLSGVSRSVSCGHYPYSSTNCSSDFCTSPLTARAAAEPTGPNNRTPAQLQTHTEGGTKGSGGAHGNRWSYGPPNHGRKKRGSTC